MSIVSSKALQIWNADDRRIKIDGQIDINLKGVDLRELLARISKAQQEMKEDPNSKGGNSTKRIQISAPIDSGTWKEIVFGKGEKTIPLTEDEIEAQAHEFSPEDAEQEKEKIARLISLRRGQPIFRKKLLAVYENRCAITGTKLPEILEAAHIVPYMGENTNHITNGLLLRADIHTLFDLGLIGVNQNYEVVVSSKLSDTEYESFNGISIKLPANKSEQPSLAALGSRPLPSRH